MHPDLLRVTSKLFEYCRSGDWAGYDPYDALNSELFKKLPFLDFWLPRLALTQILKRSPVNIRRLLMIPKTQNPKALALFLKVLLNWQQGDYFNRDSEIGMMVERIKSLRSPDTSYWCWGYSFPWQGRSVLAPRGEPNIVCTVFVADALMDAYETFHDENYLAMAASAAEYLLNELFWSEGDKAGFSYPLPSYKTRVHNANFLGASLFCRIYKHRGEKKFLEAALKTTRYSAGMQHPDGDWYYGEHETQHWIDNFHTGYNLGALKTICNCLDTDEFEPHIRKGFRFYRDHFFREDGAPKYFHNNVYPIDIHSVAQSIITLIEFKYLDQANIDLAHRVFEWSMQNMWDKRGFFYYQITPLYKNRIPYMRWSEAWMLLALSILCNSARNDD